MVPPAAVSVIQTPWLCRPPFGCTKQLPVMVMLIVLEGLDAIAMAGAVAVGDDDVVAIEHHTVITGRPDAVGLGLRTDRRAEAVMPDDNRVLADRVAHIVAARIAAARIAGIDAVVLQHDAGAGIPDKDPGIAHVADRQARDDQMIAPVDSDAQ